MVCQLAFGRRRIAYCPDMHSMTVHAPGGPEPRADWSRTRSASRCRGHARVGSGASMRPAAQAQRRGDHHSPWMPSSCLRIVVLLAGTLMLGTGCTSGNVVFGNVPPTTFQFRTVVEHDGSGPGGWQVAQVVVLLGRLSTMFPRAATCDVEVGMPVVNRRQGYLSPERAQEESAIAADRAAHKLLGERKQPTAALCISFRATMQYFLHSTVAGAKVDTFRPWPGKKIPRRTFPPKRGR